MSSNTHFIGNSTAARGLRLAMVAACTFLSCATHAANCTATPTSGKNYYIVNEANSLYLDVFGWNKDNGAAVGVYSSTSKTNQQWTVTDVGSGSWSIRPVHTNKSLDVNGWSKDDGAAIKQWEYFGNGNQQWQLSSTSNGSFKIKSSYSGKFITVDGKATDSSYSTIYQNSDTSSANQRWYFNPVDGNCPSSFGSFLDGKKLLTGGQMEDQTALSAPFPVRYRYIHSQVPKQAACYKECSDACKGWWGCWSDSKWNHEPGLSVSYQVKTPPKTMATSLADGQTQDETMLWTWYSLRDLGDQAGYSDGPKEVNAVNDAKLLKGYMDDYRFFLQKIGNAKNIVHLEPDFWGYVNSINSNPHKVPAQVTAANSTDCANEENSASGLASCLISMARKYAPNSLVGLHVSCWNWAAEGEQAKCVQFYKDLGGAKGDMLVTDATDRDAGWYELEKSDKSKWWSDSDFTKYLAYIKLLTEGVGKPMMVWQIPLGNSSMNNTYQHYKDNKVDYFFSHTSDVANAHIVALLFGSGHTAQTYPESDGGNLISKTKAYWKSGGTSLR